MTQAVGFAQTKKNRVSFVFGTHNALKSSPRLETQQSQRHFLSLTIVFDKEFHKPLV